MCTARKTIFLDNGKIFFKAGRTLRTKRPPKKQKGGGRVGGDIENVPSQTYVVTKNNGSTIFFFSIANRFHKSESRITSSEWSRILYQCRSPQIYTR